tara:strand:+ start:2070 stop:2258 length:189 start_codon:yes stop_codon:yes gene_type:complete
MTPNPRRRAVRPFTPDLENEHPGTIEIDGVPDDDDHDLIAERLERVDRFSSAGSFDWIGPED